MHSKAVFGIICALFLLLLAAPAVFSGGSREAGEEDTGTEVTQETTPSQSTVSAAEPPAGVGANFEPTGTALGGSINIHYYGGYLFSGLSSTDYLTINVRPTAGMFVIRNLQLTISPSYYYYTDFSGGGLHRIGIGSGVNYFFYSGGTVVPSVGTSLYLWYWFDSGFSLGFYPNFNVYFFVTDQIAPYTGVYLNFDFQDLSDFDYTAFSTGVSVGVVYFIPEAVGPRS